MLTVSNVKDVTNVWRQSVVLIFKPASRIQLQNGSTLSLLLDARAGCAVAFPCKANIAHLAPAIGKPFEKPVNSKS
jgi:hypothetical protein